MDDENPTTKADQNVVVVVVQNQNSSNLSIKGLIMVCIGSVLLVGCIIFIILFYLYFRNRHRNNNRRSSSSSSSSSDEGSSRGLEPTVLKTLSDFRYSSNSNCGGRTPPQKECAVCLSEFEEDEMGRVLPNCKHSFHLQCIDIWFKFNSNCPLCRTQVAAVLPAVNIKNPDDRADVDVGLESGFSSGLNHAPPVSPREEEEENDIVIICSTSTYEDKKLPAELTSII